MVNNVELSGHCLEIPLLEGSRSMVDPHFTSTGISGTFQLLQNLGTQGLSRRMRISEFESPTLKGPLAAPVAQLAARFSMRKDPLHRSTLSFDSSGSAIALFSSSIWSEVVGSLVTDLEVLKVRQALDQTASRYSADDFDNENWVDLFDLLFEKLSESEQGIISWLSYSKRNKSFTVDFLENLALSSNVHPESLNRILCVALRSSNPNVRYGAALAVGSFQSEQCVTALQRAIGLEHVSSVRETLLKAWQNARH